MVQTQHSSMIKALQSDNGGEYVAVHRLCGRMGIQSRYSCPYTSQQNGRAERKHRHIVEIELTLLAQAHMPLTYWWDAFLVAMLLINGFPSHVLHGQSPMERLFHITLNFMDLRTFGCVFRASDHIKITSFNITLKSVCILAQAPPIRVIAALTLKAVCLSPAMFVLMKKSFHLPLALAHQ